MSTDQEYLQYVDAERLVFILFDRLDSKRSTVQVRAWEIWPAVPRHSYFRWFVDNYYRENYQKKVSLGKKPSPLNLHPLKFDFYMMNPVRTFTALISRADSTDAAIAVDLMIDPSLNRDAFSAEPMPAGVLTPGERVELLTNPKVQAEDLASANPETLTAPQIRAMRSKPSTVRKLATALRFIDEASRLQIPARVKRIKLSDSDYERR